MIIHQPEVFHHNDHAILWSRIEMSEQRNHFPDYIWYRVPVKYAPFLIPQSDAFLVAGLLAGMYFGEEIEVRGAISPRLAYHLKEYQFVLSHRMPNVVRPVSIQYEKISPIGETPKGVGTTFSGGVDSLFTVHEHLAENQPDPNYQITHGVFVQGFDILHTEKNNYDKLLNAFSAEALKTGIEVIKLETNLIGIAHKRMNLSYLYGPLIVSIGLALSGLFKRFYIPSSWDYDNLQKKAYSSDPLIDGFLSTDTTQIIHHGSMSQRIEKVEKISNWGVAQKILWVCLEARFKNSYWNCSRCEKCVRTMIPLYSLGVLDKFKTFEKPMTKNIEVLWYARKFNMRSNYLSEMFPYFRRQKPKLLPWLTMAKFLGYFRYVTIKYLPSFIKQFSRRFGYFVLRNEADDCYENPEITRLIETEIKSNKT